MLAISHLLGRFVANGFKVAVRRDDWMKRRGSASGTPPTLKGGAKPVRLCPSSSDVNLLSYGEGIIEFNAEIPDGALDLRMSQQQLHGT